MAQPTELFVSKAFSKANAASYSLCLSVGDGGMMAAVGPKGGEVHLASRYVNPDPDLKPYEFLDKVMFDGEVFKLAFAQVQIISQALRWALVPSNFAAKADLLPLLQVHHDVSPTTDRVLTEELKPQDITVLYALTNMLVKRCDYYFKKYSIEHGVTRLIRESLRLHSVLGAAYSVQVSFIEGRFYLIITGTKGIQLANAFTAAAAEDVLYYVLTALEQLGIDRAEAAVYTTGRGPLTSLTAALLDAHLPKATSVASQYAQTPELTKAGWSGEQLVQVWGTSAS
jgi:hypothetical protein